MHMLLVSLNSKRTILQATYRIIVSPPSSTKAASGNVLVQQSRPSQFSPDPLTKTHDKALKFCRE